ncbi:exodeoxyribonuclease III [Emcibacter sp.]|uniref:exodeoxyribonuclease III n=1 Tax=Emcibacter sp. TaxID=1979954 RepID=UPI003A92EB78
MKIASWNVNSVKARLPRVVEWLSEFQPDVVLLQELKCIDENFPRMEIEDLGYNVVTHGQKTYNGVAILSKYPIEDVMVGLPGDTSDEQARYLEATVNTVRVAAIYLPNGNPVPGEKFDYKLRWMDRLIKRAKKLLKTEEVFVLGGDYNVCPMDEDCYAPERFASDALCMPESRDRYWTLVNLGLTDALRAFHPSGHNYTYWDYQAGAWQKDNGLRIDHLLLSPQAADKLKACDVDRKPRGREKASDHTPIWCELDVAG